jgi:hypothetical protein
VYPKGEGALSRVVKSSNIQLALVPPTSESTSQAEGRGGGGSGAYVVRRGVPFHRSMRASVPSFLVHVVGGPLTVRRAEVGYPPTPYSFLFEPCSFRWVLGWVSAVSSSREVGRISVRLLNHRDDSQMGGTPSGSLCLPGHPTVTPRVKHCFIPLLNFAHSGPTSVLMSIKVDVAVDPVNWVPETTPQAPQSRVDRSQGM